MAIKTVTSFGTLMKLAHALGQAKLHGTPEDIEKAQKDHDVYRDLCLESDEIDTGLRYGHL